MNISTHESAGNSKQSVQCSKYSREMNKNTPTQPNDPDNLKGIDQGPRETKNPGYPRSK
jgi:hypothetical protein